MTGPEHYKEAQRLIIAANSASPSTDVSDTIATAQVHATLALAAIVARGRTSGDDPWVEITETPTGVPF